MINPELEKFLELHEYIIERLIFFNPSKGRYTLSILDKDRKKFLLKWNSEEDKFRTSLASLRNEIELYNSKQGRNFFIQYIESGANYLILYFIESETLREYLLHYATITKEDVVRNSFKQVINQIIEIYQGEYISNSIMDYDKKAFYISMKKRIYQLGMSGPMRNFPKGIKRLLIRCCLSLTYPFLKKTCYAINCIQRNKNHGDFHLNNILIGPDLSLYIIDLENYSDDYILSDICYSFILVRKAIRKLKNHIQYANDMFYRNFKNEDVRMIKRILSLYEFIVSLNDCF